VGQTARSAADAHVGLALAAGATGGARADQGVRRTGTSRGRDASFRQSVGRYHAGN